MGFNTVGGKKTQILKIQKMKLNSGYLPVGDMFETHNSKSHDRIKNLIGHKDY